MTTPFIGLSTTERRLLCKSLDSAATHFDNYASIVHGVSPRAAEVFTEEASRARDLQSRLANAAVVMVVEVEKP